MNRILYKITSDGTLLLIFFIQGGERTLFFDGNDFTNAAQDDAASYQELEYSAKVKDKSGLEVKALKHTGGQVFFVELANGDIFEIKYAIQGYGEISQRLIIVKQTGKHDEYERQVLEEYKSAKEIDQPRSA